MKLKALLLLLCFGFTSMTARALDIRQKDECPMVWAEYIKTVAESLKHRSSNDIYIMIFSDEDGYLYNCLGESISEKELRSQEVINKAITRITKQEYAKSNAERVQNGLDPYTAGIISYSTFRGLNIYIIDLPLDPADLKKSHYNSRVPLLTVLEKALTRIPY